LDGLVDIILDLQLLKENIPSFRGPISDTLDFILSDYDSKQLQLQNKQRMWTLKQCLSGLQTGQAVIAECRTFESMNLFEMNKKLQTKGIEDVIAEVTGEDVAVIEDSGMVEVLNVDNCDQRAKDVLSAKYNEFKRHYEKVIT
jgi:hypothetical protein